MIPPLPHLLGVAASSMVAFSCHHPSSPAAMDAGTLLAGMISLECLSSYGKASAQHKFTALESWWLQIAEPLPHIPNIFPRPSVRGKG